MSSHTPPTSAAIATTAATVKQTTVKQTTAKQTTARQSETTTNRSQNQRLLTMSDSSDDECPYMSSPDAGGVMDSDTDESHDGKGKGNAATNGSLHHGVGGAASDSDSDSDDEVFRCKTSKKFQMKISPKASAAAAGAATKGANSGAAANGPDSDDDDLAEMANFADKKKPKIKPSSFLSSGPSSMQKASKLAAAERRNRSDLRKLELMKKQLFSDDHQSSDSDSDCDCENRKSISNGRVKKPASGRGNALKYTSGSKRKSSSPPSSLGRKKPGKGATASKPMVSQNSNHSDSDDDSDVIILDSPPPLSRASAARKKAESEKENTTPRRTRSGRATRSSTRAAAAVATAKMRSSDDASIPATTSETRRSSRRAGSRSGVSATVSPSESPTTTSSPSSRTATKRKMKTRSQARKGRKKSSPGRRKRVSPAKSTLPANAASISTIDLLESSSDEDEDRRVSLTKLKTQGASNQQLDLLKRSRMATACLVQAQNYKAEDSIEILDSDDDDDDENDAGNANRGDLAMAHKELAAAALGRDFGKTLRLTCRTMVEINGKKKMAEQRDQFKLKEREPFRHLQDQLLQKYDLPASTRITLHFDGGILQPKQTPQQCELEDEDMLDVKCKAIQIPQVNTSTNHTSSGSSTHGHKKSSGHGPMLSLRLRCMQKVRGQKRPQLVEITIHHATHEPFHSMPEKYRAAAKLKKSSRIEFKFDGDTLNLGSKPSDHDMESDELIDVIVRN